MESNSVGIAVEQLVRHHTRNAIICFGAAGGLLTSGTWWLVIIGLVVAIFGISAINSLGDMCMKSAKVLDDVSAIAERKIHK